MNSKTIANKLNQLSHNYDFGNLPQIRINLNEFKFLNKKIFTHQTIKDGYAFHNGGRRETQFNFGYETKRNLFRFGIAFSLEKNRTLLEPVKSFLPRINKFNEHIKQNKEYYKDIVMWAFQNGKLVLDITPINVIPDNLIQEKTFIFIGKYIEKKAVKDNPSFYSEILETFDRLLPIYEYIESNFKSLKQQRSFKFKSGIHPRKTETTKQSIISKKKIKLKHHEMVKNVYQQFVKIYKYENVSAENPTPFGTSIDLVLKLKKEFVFYEFKTSGSLREIIREAFSQLMEYSYYPSNNTAKKMIIVSTNPMNPECQDYLKHIRKKFTIPVYYQRYNETKKHLEDKEY